MFFRLLRRRSLLLPHATARPISTTSFSQSGAGAPQNPTTRAKPPRKGPSSAALSRSREDRGSTTDNPDRLQNLLRLRKIQILQRTFQAYDLPDSKSIVGTILRKFPKFLNFDAENTIKPKLDFLYYSSGFQPREVADIVASNPGLLRLDLNKTIIPLVRFLKDFIPEELSSIAVILLKRRRCIVSESNCLSIIEVLQKHCISKYAILRILLIKGIFCYVLPRRLDRTIGVMKGVGFDLNSRKFSAAVNIFSTNKDERIARKIELFRSFGCKDEEIFKFICLYPQCIGLSDESTKKKVDFFKEVLHWEASQFVNTPQLINANMEKRIKSRGAVLNLLMLKGQISRSTGCRRFAYSHKYFHDRYVERYRNKVVGVVEAYEGGAFEGWEHGCPEKVWVKF